MKHAFLIILLLSLMLILCSCGGNTEPPIPLYEDLTDITMQEYEGDEPVGMEISIGFSYNPAAHQGTFFYMPGHSEWKQVVNDKKLPQRKYCFLFRFTDRNGVTAEAFLFEDEKYDYLEIPSEGIWREKKDGTNNWMDWYDEKYPDFQFRRCYAEPLLSNQLSLLENYNGAEKAILADITRGEAMDSWDSCIPAEWEAERAEDVRYVFVVGIRSQAYIGYWYNAQTGEKVEDAYEKTYIATVYDLVNGSEETLYTGTDIFDAYDAVEAYFIR